MRQLQKISILNLRNVAHAHLENLGRFNLIYGLNGAGKTSILEGVSYIGLGRSFRSRKAQTVIGSCSSDLVVQGVLSANNCADITVGVKRSKQVSLFKIDGQAVLSASSLAINLPLLLIDASSFQLILGGPAKRREFVDWGLFHVEQKPFQKLWSAYYKALKQRNEIFKRGKINLAELSAWDIQFAKLGEALHLSRVSYIEKLASSFNDFSGLCLFKDFKVTVKKGWSDELTLSEALKNSRDRDSKTKTSNVGPHRFDLKFSIDGVDVQEYLSRGQIKTLVSSLQLANASLVKSLSGRAVLVLIDDLVAEMDLHNRKALLVLLNRLGFQVMITSINLQDLQQSLPDGVSATVFHVEHGCITKE